MVGRIERDAARLLVLLHGALASRDLDVLRQVKQIATKREEDGTTALSRSAYNTVVKAANKQIAYLQARNKS
jgi:hypothetical protein